MDPIALVDMFNKITIPAILGIAVVVLWRVYQDCINKPK